jgi:hypothetical protein
MVLKKPIEGGDYVKGTHLNPALRKKQDPSKRKKYKKQGPALRKKSKKQDPSKRKKQGPALRKKYKERVPYGVRGKHKKHKKQEA